MFRTMRSFAHKSLEDKGKARLGRMPGKRLLVRYGYYVKNLAFSPGALKIRLSERAGTSDKVMDARQGALLAALWVC